MSITASRRSFLQGIAATLAFSATGASLVIPEAKAYAPKKNDAGWLLCDGQAVSREEYAEMFATIGTAYGNGDGKTTFNLPDLRGRAAIPFRDDTQTDSSIMVYAINPKSIPMQYGEMPTGTIHAFLAR